VAISKGNKLQAKDRLLNEIATPRYGPGLAMTLSKATTLLNKTADLALFEEKRYPKQISMAPVSCS
jgi:hypothetical protein